MENDSDTLNILSADETQTTYEILNGELQDGIPLQIMSGEHSRETISSEANDKDSQVRPTADDNGHNTLSSSSSCCRICQNGDSAEQLLENSPCRCRGYLGKAHKKCLVEWVRYKGSNRCEICGANFEGIPPPPQLGVNQIEPDVEPPTANGYFEALEALRWQLERYRPISGSRRSAMAAVILFLSLVTFVTAVLTVGADRDFRRVTRDPWASRNEQEKAHIVFSICISFLFFTGTLTIGLGLLWLLLECFFAVHRRRVIQRTAERMIADSIRQRRLAAENSRTRTGTGSIRDRNHEATTSDRSRERIETSTPRVTVVARAGDVVVTEISPNRRILGNGNSNSDSENRGMVGVNTADSPNRTMSHANSDDPLRDIAA